MQATFDVDKIFALPGYYKEFRGNVLPKIFLDFLTLEDGTSRLSRNVGK